MKRSLRTIAIGAVVLAVIVLVACENPTALTDDETDGSGDGTADDTSLIDPPDNLIATIALNDGSSAVVDITFTEDTSSAQVTTLATYTIDGTVRYNSVTFDAEGTYDSENGDASMSATAGGGSSFTISGTWDPDTGFTGTASLKNPEGTEIAAGSINGVGLANGEESSVSVFVGTYGGTAYGSWNGVIEGDRFYGTYAASDGSDDSGSFTASYDSATGAITDGVSGSAEIPFGGSVSDNGESISGWYAGTTTGDDGTDVSVSGTWSGVTVDDNYDAPDIGVTSDGELIANRVFQAIGSAVRVAQDTLSDDPTGTTENVSIETGDPSVTVDTNVTVSFDADYEGEISEDTFLGFVSLTISIGSSGYTDPISGLTLGQGEVYATFDATASPGIRDFKTLRINNPSADEVYITITFPDDSTGNLGVSSGTIDAENETVGGDWEFPDAGVGDPPNDVSDVVQAALF